MTASSPQRITQLNLAWSDGDQAALAELMAVVYAELHCRARRDMRREKQGHTLQTSALVNEAYLRMVDAHSVRWQKRAHFFGVSARIMRHIPIDLARETGNLKRGDVARRITLDERLAVSPSNGTDLLALGELRYFGGLHEEEVAEALSSRRAP